MLPQLFKTIDKSVDDANPMQMAKVIGRDTLEALAREIAALHQPIAFDWSAKFGLPAVMSSPTVAASAQKPAAPSPVIAKPAAPTAPIASAQATEEAKAKQKLVCDGS